MKYLLPKKKKKNYYVCDLLDPETLHVKVLVF